MATPGSDAATAPVRVFQPVTTYGQEMGQQDPEINSRSIEFWFPARRVVFNDETFLGGRWASPLGEKRPWVFSSKAVRHLAG